MPMYFLFHELGGLLRQVSTIITIAIILQRETRGNRAPTVKTYTALNDTIGKSPVYYARDHVETRNIHSLYHFKTIVHKDMNDTYIAEEMARLTAGLFI